MGMLLRVSNLESSCPAGIPAKLAPTAGHICPEKELTFIRTSCDFNFNAQGRLHPSLCLKFGLLISQDKNSLLIHV